MRSKQFIFLTGTFKWKKIVEKNKLMMTVDKFSLTVREKDE